MKKKTPFLDFYKECMQTSKIPGFGLCRTRISATIEFGMIDYDSPCYGYWGYNGKPLSPYRDANGDLIFAEEAERIRTAFTPLRQTIVLLCAAMNNEL